jgi:hypothetical protein
MKDISDYVSNVVYSDKKMRRDGGVIRRSWSSRSCLKKRTECKGIPPCSVIGPLIFYVQVPMGILSAGGAAALSPSKYSADP